MIRISILVVYIFICKTGSLLAEDKLKLSRQYIELKDKLRNIQNDLSKIESSIESKLEEVTDQRDKVGMLTIYLEKSLLEEIFVRGIHLFINDVLMYEEKEIHPVWIDSQKLKLFSAPLVEGKWNIRLELLVSNIQSKFNHYTINPVAKQIQIEVDQKGFNKNLIANLVRGTKDNLLLDHRFEELADE